MPKVKPGRERNYSSSAPGTAAGGGPSNHSGGLQTVRTLLAPNTSIGQHFLKNPAIVDSIVAKV